MPRLKSSETISSLLLAKSKGRQLAQSLFLDTNGEPFIMPEYDINIGWEDLSVLFHKCCSQSLLYHDTQFTTDEREKLIKLYQDTFSRI